MIVLQGRRGEGCFPFSQLVQVRSFFFRGGTTFFSSYYLIIWAASTDPLRNFRCSVVNWQDKLIE